MEKVSRQTQTKRPPRVSVDLPVILIFEEEQFRCRAVQLSEFGILVVPTYRDRVGKSVQLRLILEPPNPSLFLSGIVAFATSGELGIRFKDISQDQLLQLKRYVHACST